MNAMKRDYIRPIDFKRGVVDMSHGSGGRAMAQLVDELFLAAFDNEWLREMNDQARVPMPRGRLVVATDSHVITPLFFPGGDIGCLSVHGTVNDVAMAGAKPLYLTSSFILEKGKGDGVFINTTGVGVVPEGSDVSGNRARPGDAILVSGTMGDHGVAIMSLRENLTFETTIASDTQALHRLVAAMGESVPTLHCLRDPTRGGLATTLNEIARQSGVGMRLEEAAIPVRAEVAAACEFLGLDPLYVANEGKLVAICSADDAPRLLSAMRAHPQGRDAAIIGEVVEAAHHFVQMRTGFGGSRMVDWLAGEQLPRIC